MKKIVLVITVVLFASCKKEPVFPYPYPCLDGQCNSSFWVDTLSNPSSKLGVDGYWRVKYDGLHYFTIKGQLAELDPKYVINKVPLIETRYDSDYWIVFDTLSFKIPTYSYLSWFTNSNLNKPLPIGSKTYTISQLNKLTDLYNLAGYQITKNMCLDCPYTPTLLGTYSKYNYNPTQCFFFDKSMVGDTASIFIQITFNTDNGSRAIKEKEMKIIFE